jgi:hypothetical protein
MGVRSLKLYAELCRRTAPKAADAAERLIETAEPKDLFDDRSRVLAAAQR